MDNKSEEFNEMDIRPVEPIFKTGDSKNQSKNTITKKDKDTKPVDDKEPTKNKTRIIDILV